MIGLLIYLGINNKHSVFRFIQERVCTFSSMEIKEGRRNRDRNPFLALLRCGRNLLTVLQTDFASEHTARVYFCLLLQLHVAIRLCSGK
jgi:hypothetical protein